MAKSDSEPGIEQLVLQHKRLFAKIEYGGLSAEEAEEGARILEALDLKIAATRAETIAELGLKIERLAALLWPSDTPMPEDSLEHVMLASLVRDAAALVADPQD